jgi:hypothetical protein
MNSSPQHNLKHPTHTFNPMKNQRVITPVIAALCTLCFIGNSTAQSSTKPSISGNFIGNAKNATLKFVTAEEDKPFDDKPAIKLRFSEKDPSNAKKGHIFGDELGCMLTFSVLHDGQIFSCQVNHTALKKSGFSTSGDFKMVEFKIADGTITGRVSSAGEQEFFGDKYEADLSFTVPMPKSPSEAIGSAAQPSAGPLTAAQKAFLDGYKKALATKDTKALAAYLHTEGATADTIEFFTMMQSAGTDEQLDSIELIKPSDEDMKKYNKPTEMPDGQLCKMPFAPTHQMVIVTKDGSGGTSTSRLPVGEHKGKLLIPLPVPVNASSKPAASAPGKSSKRKPAEAPAQEAKAESAPIIAARKLPLPKDASGVEYKQGVDMIQFTSPRSVIAVAKELADSLKTQGWKEGKGNLMGATSSILHRELGAAKLTIMIKSAAQGSETKIFTEGLDWTSAGDEEPSASKKPTSVPTADELEGKANKAIQDALKNLPKGLRF